VEWQKGTLTPTLSKKGKEKKKHEKEREITGKKGGKYHSLVETISREKRH